MKYVDAEALAKRMLKASLTGANLNKDFQGIINMMPPADVSEKRKSGWIQVSCDEFGCCNIYVCLACGNFASMQTDFCPNCGADMKEEKTDE